MARKKQGNFVDPSATVQSDDQFGEFSVPGAQIIEVEQESWVSIIFGWVKSIFLFLVLAVAVLAALYSGMAATVMIYTPIGNESHIVARGVWADNGGIAPAGSIVAVSPEAAPDSWYAWGITGWTGIPDASAVKVVVNELDMDTLYITGKDVENLKFVSLNNETVNGDLVYTPALGINKKATNINVEEKLGKQYLVECIEGGCTPGTYFIVDAANVYGEIR